MTGHTYAPEQAQYWVSCLLSDGWRIFIDGGVTRYVEPRTGEEFFLHQAVSILLRHRTHSTKPLAVETGTEAHSNAYTMLGKPELVGAHSRCGKSVWFSKTKEVAKYLATAGHLHKHRTKRR